MADGIRGSFHGALGKSTLLPAARASEVGHWSANIQCISADPRSQGALKRCSPTVCSAPHGLTFGVPRRSTASCTLLVEHQELMESFTVGNLATKNIGGDANELRTA